MLPRQSYSKNDRSPSAQLNMTPIIDIIFLLIIFFALVCHFVDAENFPVQVPSGCTSAQSDKGHAGRITTVTVMKDAAGGAKFAVGPVLINATGGELVRQMAELINERLSTEDPTGNVVTLRVGRDVCFSHSQYALAAVAASNARNLRLAVLKTK